MGGSVRTTRSSRLLPSPGVYHRQQDLPGAAPVAEFFLPRLLLFLRVVDHAARREIKAQAQFVTNPGVSVPAVVQVHRVAASQPLKHGQKEHRRQEEQAQFDSGVNPGRLAYLDPPRAPDASRSTSPGNENAWVPQSLDLIGTRRRHCGVRRPVPPPGSLPSSSAAASPASPESER